MRTGGDLELIIGAAREAGQLASDLRSQGLHTEYKAGDSPVTNADLAADQLLKTRLGAARPDYGWLSEETADDSARLARRRLFVVDPIDGTRAFVRERPWWAVSVAVVEDGEAIAGVVFAPQRSELYSAEAGQGARLNGEPIHASLACDVEGCRMVGNPKLFAYPMWPIPWPDMQIDQRNSTAYSMCLVASGESDAAIAVWPKHDWDLAAADLIAREAGCVVSDHLGRRFRYNRADPIQRSLICVAPGLAPLILERVRHIAD